MRNWVHINIPMVPSFYLLVKQDMFCQYEIHAYVNTGIKILLNSAVSSVRRNFTAKFISETVHFAAKFDQISQLIGNNSRHSIIQKLQSLM